MIQNDPGLKERIMRVDKQLQDSGMSPLTAEEIKSLSGSHPAHGLAPRAGQEFRTQSGFPTIPTQEGYLGFQDQGAPQVTPMARQQVAQGGLLQGMPGFSANISIGSDGQVQGIQLKRDKQKLTGA